MLVGIGENRIRDRPLDPERRVVPTEPSAQLWFVGRRHLVQHIGCLGQDTVSVSEAGWDPEHVSGIDVEGLPDPTPVGPPPMRRSTATSQIAPLTTVMSFPCA